MRRFRFGLRILSALAITAGVAAAIYWYYFRPQYRTAAELAGLLPRSDAVLFYANVDLLRQAGILRALEGAKTIQDSDYRSFVSGTGFDYERDLDAIAVASIPNQVFAVLRGRFDWKRLRAYATAEGGSCRGTYCQVSNPKSGRWFSFFPIRSDVMAVAVSPDTNAAYTLLPRRGAPAFIAPDYPAWIQVPRRILDNPNDMPPAAQVFARALSPASQVTFGVERPVGGSQSGFLVRMLAHYDSDKEATLVAENLTRLTRLLGRLGPQGAPPKTLADPADQGVHELLSSATFIAGDGQVKGEWRIPGSLLDSILK